LCPFVSLRRRVTVPSDIGGNLSCDRYRSRKEHAMLRLRRLSITPGTTIALIALFFALGGSAYAVGDRMQGASAPQARCANGNVRGIAVVTGIASQGMANFPDKFTSAGNLFSRKYNCAGKAVQARRVDTGVFEVRFVGVSGGSAVASASGDAIATAQAGPNGTFSVIMHPAGRDDRADIPFTVVVV
jgi:hypothetical protein